MKIIYQRITIVILLFCFFSAEIVAQRANGLAVEGKINVQQGSVDGAIIQMFQDGRRMDNYGVGPDGNYKVELNYNHKFELIFSRPDNFPQKIVVETAVPQNILQTNPRFPPFPLDINLFAEIPGIDRRFSENTVLKIYYSPNVDNFISELYLLPAILDYKKIYPDIAEKENAETLQLHPVNALQNNPAFEDPDYLI